MAGKRSGYDARPAPAASAQPLNTHLETACDQRRRVQERAGLFLREGQVKLRDGWCVAGEVPPAHFGTLAIYSHAKSEMVDIVGSGSGERSSLTARMLLPM